MQIRPVTAADAAEVEAIFAALSRFYEQPEGLAPARLRQAAEFLCQPPDWGPVGLLARLDGEAAGLAVLNRLFPAASGEGLLLKDLFVLDHARGYGVGRALLQACAAYAREHGFDRLDWTADESNPAAGAFYDALGVPQVGKRYYRLAGDLLERVAADPAIGARS